MKTPSILIVLFLGLIFSSCNKEEITSSDGNTSSLTKVSAKSKLGDNPKYTRKLNAKSRETLDFIWIRVQFSDGASFLEDGNKRIDLTMEELDRYLKQQSNGKTKIGSYTVTPIFRSPLSNKIDLKNNVSTIKNEMVKIAKANGFNTVGKRIYLFFATENPQIGGGVIAAGDTAWQPLQNDGSFYPPGIIHETFHILPNPVGHACFTIGKDIDDIYPIDYDYDGLDPYFFMGSEKNTIWEPHIGELKINASINIPMKVQLGWVNSDDLIVESEVVRKTYRIFASDTPTYPNNKKVGLVLKGYNLNKDNGTNKGVFYLSYFPNATSPVIKTKGLLLHGYFENQNEISFILDLHPNSVEGNPVNQGADKEKYDKLYELGDAALSEGETVKVGDLFKIKVIREGRQDDKKWVDIEIEPIKTCHRDTSDYVFISLKSASNKNYVSSENGKRSITVNDDTVQCSQQFRLISNDDGTFSFQGNNGRYISSENGKKAMKCNRKVIGPWEKFELITIDKENSIFAIKGNNGKYVTLNSNLGRVLFCRKSEVLPWSRFIVHILS